MRQEAANDVPHPALARWTYVLIALVSSLAGCGRLMRQATIAYMAVNSRFAPKEVEIEIDKSFIEQYKNRVSIHTTLTVDKAMASPLPPALDGDLHFAGRAPQVGLPIVAEIANARDEKAAIDLVHSAEGPGKRPLEVSGVWRIWPEHAGTAEEQQGDPLLAFMSYKPDHVFEIHPITVINGVRLHGFTPIKGFSPGTAQKTFAIFEKVSCELEVKPKTVSIKTQTGLYNDVRFMMQLTDDPHVVVADGRFVFASVMDLDGVLLVKRLRMVFARGTPPELAVRRLHGGDRLEVYGMPRLDLAEISRRVRDSRNNPALLKQLLPYEVIILGVYEH